MSYLFAYILLAIATIFVALWLWLFLKYKDSFDQEVLAIDAKRFFLPQLFVVGYGFLAVFRINLKTEYFRRKERRLAEVYGAKYAEYHNLTLLAGMITYALTMVPIGLCFGAATNNLVFALLGIMMAVVLVLYLEFDLNQAVEAKRDEIISDFPAVLSKLTLLINAGLVVRKAWANVAATSDRALYKEMQVCRDEMDNGVAELDAIYNFAQRCSVKEIKKFASVFSQNLQKGGSELSNSLKFMNEESWEEKKHRAKIQGELARSKLLIPIMVMFAGILLMIIVPIFTNMFN